jgi:citrate lyase subunit beta/citryl-CoA lyase
MFRSLLFIPANNAKFIAKSYSLSPDILCYDLEDSVPINEKQNARNNICSIFEQNEFNKNSFVYVRINSTESGLFESDLRTIIHRGLNGIVIPKVNTISDIAKINEVIKQRELSIGLEVGALKLIPSIESAKGVIDAYKIAKSARVTAVVFGIFDFLYDMGIADDESITCLYARSKIPVDAVAAGVVAIDGIWQKIDDISGLEKDAKLAKKMGYAGKSIIHPSHIDPTHRIFTPTPKQIEWARKVLNLMQETIEKGSGKGAARLEGKMVDAVHYKQAKLVLDAANLEDQITNSK